LGTFDWFKLLIEPIGEQLQKDPRFQNVMVRYDRDVATPVEQNVMPCINYFLDATPWSDESRGTGATSMKTRRASIVLRFGIWCANADPKELDRQLFAIASDLFDFFYEEQNYDPIHGVFILGDLRWDVDYAGSVGSQRIQVVFEALIAP